MRQRWSIGGGSCISDASCRAEITAATSEKLREGKEGRKGKARKRKKRGGRE